MTSLNDFIIYKKCVIYKTKRMFNNARRMKGGLELHS